MDDAKKAMGVYNTIKLYHQHAIEDEIKAKSQLAAAIEGDKLHKAQDEYGGGWSKSPYDTNLAASRADSAEKKRKEWADMVDYVVQTFLNGKKP